MDLTPEQRLIQEMVHKFASTELQPVAAEIDEGASFPYQVIEKLSELGFLGIIVPDKYEGANLDTVSYCLIIEELSRVCGSVGTILIANNALVAYPILRYGGEAQKNHWLAPLAKGQIIGAFALSEGAVDTDLAELATKAERVGDEYIISGGKNFIVNAEAAGLFIVLASTPQGPTAFLIERGSPGLKVTKREDTLGGKASGIGDLELAEVKVGKESILGKEGEGQQISKGALDLVYIGIGAQAVGIGEAALEESIHYAKERHQFGRPICEFELVQNMLVEMEIRLSSSRLFVYNTANKCAAQNSCTTEASLTKLLATDAAVFAGTNAIQVHGGYGYTKDYPVERYFRDAKFAQIWLGSAIRQKVKIAKALLER